MANSIPTLRSTQQVIGRNKYFKRNLTNRRICFERKSKIAICKFNIGISGTEDLSTNYTQDAKLGFVVNAIYTMAYALHAMKQNLCGSNYTGLCDAMSPVNGTEFLQYLLNASFPSYSRDFVIEFDKAGDPPARSVREHLHQIQAKHATYINAIP